MRKSMRILLSAICFLLLVFCVSSCADYTDYPGDGEYLCEYPYFSYHIDRLNGSSAEIDYNGKRIKADVGMIGSSFDVSDKADVKRMKKGSLIWTRRISSGASGVQTKGEYYFGN